MVEFQDELLVRKYKHGDEEEIVRLFETVFERKMPLNYWRWRYLNNPAEPGFISLAFYHDKLIGHYAVAPARAVFKNKPIQVALSMTTMTHPDFKGKGIFPRLANDVYAEAQRRGYKLIYGFPNDQSYKTFVTKLGWIDGGNMAMFTSGTNNYEAIPHHDLVLSRIEKVGSEIGELFDWICTNFDLSIEKSVDFYNWRYQNNPTTEYRIFSLQDGKKNVGIYVLKKYVDEIGKLHGHIVDFLVRDSKYLVDVLYFSMLSFYQDNVDEISLWAFGRLSKLLKLDEYQFKKHVMQRTFFGYKVLDQAFFHLNGNFSCDTFFLPMGDSDVF